MNAKETQLEYSGVTGNAFIYETERDWRLILWQHAQYIPCWDIDSKWITSEWLETIGDNSGGYNFEPMHDKECRYMRVTPLFCNDAIASVKWHYALNNTKYEIFRGNTTADEFYSIFPAGYCVRKLVGYPGNESELGGKPTFWEIAETVLINPKGTVPVDYLCENVASYFDLKGDRYEQQWSKAEFKPGKDRKYPPAKFLCDEHPSAKNWDVYIIRLHFVSGKDPFLVIPNNQSIFPHAKCGICGEDHPPFLQWPSYPMWSHWPTYEGTDFAVLIHGSMEDAMQRATHSSVVSIGAHYGGLPKSETFWEPERGTIWNLLFGVTDQPDEYLKGLAQSWLYPAEIHDIKGAEFTGYDIGQMAYIFNCLERDVEFTISPDKITQNPFFIMRDWKSEGDVMIRINSSPTNRDSIRIGMDDGDLYIWIEDRFISESKISIK